MVKLLKVLVKLLIYTVWCFNLKQKITFPELLSKTKSKCTQLLCVCLCHACSLSEFRNNTFGEKPTSQPHLETLFLEDGSLSREAGWEMFGGNKQTTQQIARPDDRGSVWASDLSQEIQKYACRK